MSEEIMGIFRIIMEGMNGLSSKMNIQNTEDYEKKRKNDAIINVSVGWVLGITTVMMIMIIITFGV